MPDPKYYTLVPYDPSKDGEMMTACMVECAVTREFVDSSGGGGRYDVLSPKVVAWLLSPAGRAAYAETGIGALIIDNAAVSKTGSTLTVEFDNPDDANALFDILSDLK